jgi:hypothetical protein
MNDNQQGYFAYLLRLWRVDDGTTPEWRASLESPYSAERRGFSSLKTLFRFLEQLTGDCVPADGQPPDEL